MSWDTNLGISGHNVHPVILELPEQQSVNSEIKKLIKQNNSQVKYSGGYKPNEKKNGVIAKQKDKYRPDDGNQMNPDEIYSKLGVSKEQPKYQLPHATEVINSEQYAKSSLQAKIELLRQDRQKRTSLLFQSYQPQDNYTLVDEPGRYQNVTHHKSSLDAPSIENVEAKLYAHRQKMKQIQQGYHAMKGKDIPIDRYNYLKVNIDVDKEYNQLDVDQDKIYALVKQKQQMQPDQVQFQQLWEMKKRNDPKLAQYDAKYQQYLVHKDAKNLIGAVVKKNLYTWDKYKQPGASPSKQKKLKPYSKPSKDRSQSPEQKQNDKSQQKQKLDSINSLTDIISSKDDKFIASYIFAQVDKNKSGLISKQQLHTFLLSQPHILKGYNIDAKWLFTDLDNFSTQRKGMLNKKQLATFLVALQKIQHPKLTLIPADQQQKTSKKQPQIKSSFAEKRNLFQKIFSITDFNNDGIIKRQEFVQNLYLDPDIVQILDSEAMEIKAIGKSITFRQIVAYILDEFKKQRNQKIKKAKEYITFKKFCEYFQIPQNLDLAKISKASKGKSQGKQSKEIAIYDIGEQHLLLLKDIFNSIPRVYQDYIVSVDFVQMCFKDPQFLAQSQELCRIESVQTGLPVQSLKTVLERIKKQSDEYTTWEELKLWFTRRGRPLDWDYALIQQKKKLRAEKLNKEVKNIPKTKIKETQEYFQYHQNLKNRSKEKFLNIPEKYTVPQPFNITDMKVEKVSKQTLKQGEKQFMELKNKFKANPINREILEPKPHLIMGKTPNKSQKTIKNEYKYQNYENDRIQRALKRAQEKYAQQQMLTQIKKQTEVKALNVAIDLTTKYKDVIKENQKKKREKSKYKPTQPKIGENLYPKNPVQEKIRKMDKIKQNIQKIDSVAKRKQNKLQEDKKMARDKNQQARRLAEQAKKRQEQQKKLREDMQAQGFDFKPKINKKQLTAEQKQNIERERAARNNKKREQEQMKLAALQKQKQKILAYEKKENWLPIEGLSDEQILQNLQQINFVDILFPQEKRPYTELMDIKNKTKKGVKERLMGLVGRQRAQMQIEQKRIMDEKRKYKEKVIKNKVNGVKQGMSVNNVEGQRSEKLADDLTFHRSKALKRYRQIIAKQDQQDEIKRQEKLKKQKQELKNSSLA